MALRALSIASTGGRALMNVIDTLANNLANVNTIGFKRSRVNFADLFYQQVQRAGFGTPGVNQQPTGLAFGSGVRLVSTEKIFTQGNPDNTGKPLDMAIEGEGFFKVLLADGTEAFTRAGNFQRDSEGNIVTTQGYRLVGPSTIPQDIAIDLISIDEAGGIFVKNPASPTADRFGEIQIFTFPNPSGLESLGDNLYKETPASGPQQGGQPATTIGFGRIRQGFIEGSNVDVIKELVDLISAQRAFEINSNSIRAADDVLQAINALRR